MIVFVLLFATLIGGVVGGVVGLFSGIALAATRHRWLLRPWASRRLAFATSAAPFLLLAVCSRLPSLLWLALASGSAGSALTSLCLNGCPAGPRPLRGHS